MIKIFSTGVSSSQVKGHVDTKLASPSSEGANIFLQHLCHVVHFCYYSYIQAKVKLKHRERDPLLVCLHPNLPKQGISLLALPIFLLTLTLLIAPLPPHFCKASKNNQSCESHLGGSLSSRDKDQNLNSVSWCSAGLGSEWGVMGVTATYDQVVFPLFIFFR